MTLDRTAKTWMIVAAGGRGERFSNRADKLLVHLGGLPILVRTVETLLAAHRVTGVIVVAPADKKVLYQRLIHESGHRKPVRFAEGGASRRDSVYRGLLALPETAEIVGIHDAARPLVNPALVNAAVARVQQGAPGIILAVPIRDTVKQTDAEGRIEKTVDRSVLWRAQTPQVFPVEGILQAHRAVPAEQPVTDDAQLLELAGLGPVEILPGEERNLKVTTPEDLAIAEALLKS